MQKQTTTDHSIRPFVLGNVPPKIISTVTYKIMMKKDYVKKDGSCNLYLELYSKGSRHRMPIQISINPNLWDAVKQKVAKKHPQAADLNLMIEQIKARTNKVIVNYRLSNQPFTARDVLESLQNPNAKVCFNAFASDRLENHKEIYTHGTYKSHKSVLKKIKEFKNPLFFNEITTELVNDYKSWLGKSPRNNNTNTIHGNLKTFKTYIGAAQKKGIYMSIDQRDIKVQPTKGRITFNTSEEIQRLDEYYHSSFIPNHRKVALQRYLFSCFTGLRAGDLWNITIDNIVEKTLVFTAQKRPNPFIRMKLNASAIRYLDLTNDRLWIGELTTQKVNEYLKEVARECGIYKNLHLHVARHTFATQYLANGGNVAKLQKLLGHTSLKQTSNYVHVVDGILEEDIFNLDGILNINTDKL